MDTLYEEALCALATARRAGRYQFTRRLATALLREAVKERDQRVVALVRSRVFYELHMGSYENAATLRHGTRRAKWLEESMNTAAESAHAADIAGDVIGVLYAEMNIGGLLLPALGRWQEGLELSREIAARAETAAERLETDKERMRALRVVTNCLFHQGRLIVEHRLDRNELVHLLEKIEASPVYKQDFKDLDNIKKDMASFHAYISD